MEQINPPVSSSVTYAGFWNRVIAYIIDAIILGIVGYLLMMVFGIGNLDMNAIDNMEYLMSIYIKQGTSSMIIGWLYYALMESSKNQGTVGKIAMRLVVTDMNGEKISFLRATGRYFGKIISAFILLIGYIMVAFTEKKQGLHDIIAGCLVIKNQD